MTERCLARPKKICSGRHRRVDQGVQSFSDGKRRKNRKKFCRFLTLTDSHMTLSQRRSLVPLCVCVCLSKCVCVCFLCVYIYMCVQFHPQSCYKQMTSLHIDIIISFLRSNLLKSCYSLLNISFQANTPLSLTSRKNGHRTNEKLR